MKKYLFLTAALTVMGCSMTSCSSDAEDVIEQNEQAPKLTKLVFTVEQDAQTRASWDGLTPVFDEGDEVSLFSANNDNVKLTAHVTAGVVTLEGMGAADDELYFVYPWNDDVHMDMGTKKITSATAPAYNINKTGNSEWPYYGQFLSSVYGINKYPANALSLAKSTDGDRVAISFKGLMAIIKFTPHSTDYVDNELDDLWIYACENSKSPTTFKGGQLTINAAGETPTIESTQTSYGIHFRKQGSGTFVAGTSYYVAFPPTDAMTGPAYIRDEFGENLNKNSIRAGFTFEAGKVYSVTDPY